MNKKLARSYATILKVKKRSIDEIRFNIKQFQDAKESLESSINQIDFNIQTALDQAQNQPGNSFLLSNFLNKSKKEIQQISIQISEIDKTIEFLQNQLTNLFIEEKSIQKVFDKLLAELKHQQNIQEQKEMDEISMDAFNN